MTNAHLKRRPFLGSLGAFGLGALTAASTRAVAAPAAPGSIALPVTGYNVATGQAVFGTFSPTAASVGQGGTLLIHGVLALTNGITQAVNLPALIQQGACTILELHLGPLDLNLLGLEIHLNRVDLVIRGNPQGGLLGELLCAIANLLSGGSPLQAVLGQIVGVLNQILGLFR